MRESNNREINAIEDAPRNAPGVRRNSVQRNFEPRGRGNNIRQDQYDPYNGRNASPPPPPRYQQQPPPRRGRGPDNGRNNDNRNIDRGRTNDYRPDYGRNQQNDYARQNDYPGNGGGRNNQEYNGRPQQNDYGRNQQEDNRGGYNNYRGNNPEGRNSYTPRYNDQPMNEGRNSYNPRYNDQPMDDGRNSYVPRYNNDDGRPSYAPRYNDVKDEGRNSYAPRYNDVKEEGRGNYIPRYNDAPVRSSPTRNYTTAAPVAQSSPAVSLIPSRQGNEVPTVQIVAWDNVAYGFTDYIERVFSSNQIRASSITLPYSKNSREEIVKQMILEGVKAIVMIDRHNETQSKVYLQVFAPAEHGQGVRYDGKSKMMHQ